MKHNKGFTLIEAIIVVAVLAIITFGIAGFIFTSMDAWMLISGRESAVTKARVAMNRMVSELRRIRKPDNDNIRVCMTSEVQFFDIDLNLIDFKRDGTNLMRNTDIMVTGLVTPEGLTFTYLDATGEATRVKRDMRSIRIWLFISSGGQTTTLESSARIRNL